MDVEIVWRAGAGVNRYPLRRSLRPRHYARP